MSASCRARVVVATGAGISAESGVPTFRGPDGLWHDRRPADVATPEAFSRNPLDVWEFYLARRRDMVTVVPNDGHRAIALWQDEFGDVPVITQNIDGLHQAAGSRRVLELHGSLWKRRCQRCDFEEEDRSTDLPGGEIPRCRCGGLLRPSVVWFGEELPVEVQREAFALAERDTVWVVVGTSNLVYPAAAIPQNALAAGAKVIEVNLERTALSSAATRFVAGKAGDILPGLSGLIRELLA